jgi:hypothetical protein
MEDRTLEIIKREFGRLSQRVLYLEGNEPSATSAMAGCFAQRTAAQAIPASAWTAINLTAADVYDTNAYHDPAGAFPSRLIVPANKAGYYQMNGRATFAPSLAAINMVAFLKNGLGSALWVMMNQGSNVVAMSLTTSGPVYLAVGNYVEFLVYHDRIGGINVTSADFAISLTGT